MNLDLANEAPSSNFELGSFTGWHRRNNLSPSLRLSVNFFLLPTQQRFSPSSRLFDQKSLPPSQACWSDRKSIKPLRPAASRPDQTRPNSTLRCLNLGTCSSYNTMAPNNSSPCPPLLYPPSSQPAQKTCATCRSPFYLCFHNPSPVHPSVVTPRANINRYGRTGEAAAECVSDDALQHLKTYQYSAVDKSPVSYYILRPYVRPSQPKQPNPCLGRRALAAPACSPR